MDKKTSEESSKQNAVNKYVKEKHTQEECIGFIDGFEAAEARVKELERLLFDQSKVNAELFERNKELEEENKELKDLLRIERETRINNSGF